MPNTPSETPSNQSGKNRLSKETSPYLLQHRDNPVHWWAWGDDAFAAAREQNKPILLSVGYAACHWCHVMAHESFETPAIADVMNRLFINIKVDREERPDVDAIYQKALSATGEKGGWPLTMFVLPDGKPFFGGTYFPPEARYGRPGFPDVLERIADVYEKDRKTVEEQAGKLTTHINRTQEGDLREPLSLTSLTDAAAHIVDHFDLIDGGLGGEPKFPMTDVLEYMWRAFLRSGEPRYKTVATLTLNRICNGGIYDHLGGGFSRYSTDSKWLAPHFEKMLYDNAQLIDVMSLVWLETRSDLYKARIEETIEWLTREMVGENGAFAATLDADSEGEEGKFYVWSEAEIDAVLDAKTAPLFKDAYDVSTSGNWEGKNILNRIDSGDRITSKNAEKLLAPARKQLFDVRAPRVRPDRDDKILADWNGLMIQALARAGMAFSNPDWISLSRTTFDTILSTMIWQDSEGRNRIAHSLCGGRLQPVDMLDDYANLIAGALALHSATGDDTMMKQAIEWADLVHALFWNEGGHGYFFTASDAENLIVRTTQVTDTATPSGNGVMLGNLARLFYLTGDDRFRIRAEALIEAFDADAMRHFPHTCAFLNGFEIFTNAIQVVVVGSRADEDVRSLLSAALSASLPNLILSTVDDTDSLPAGHAAHGKSAVDGKAAAYICRGPVCQAPVTTANDLKAALAA
ncbi:MAG: thioredoxin domain-containing protein [Rhodospirillaceae bacterium]|nr:thioredoxin domain-containing protein [Rhodospirillaceae bacterium]